MPMALALEAIIRSFEETAPWAWLLVLLLRLLLSLALRRLALTLAF